MKTITLQQPGEFVLSQTPPPSPPSHGETRVLVRSVGVCGTDIHAYRGDQPFFTYPRILGHELGVEVLEVGTGVHHVSIGDACAVEPYLNCGRCAACRAGKTNCCSSLICLGVHGDGGMREQINLPAHKLHPSAELPFDHLALVETMGIGKHAVDRAALMDGDTVAVIGLGPIGLTAIQFALARGVRVVGLDISPERCDAAHDLLPGVETLAVDPDQPLLQNWRNRHEQLPRVVFDATGHRSSMQQAFSLPEQGGTLVFIGLVIGEITFNDPDFHRKELTLMSSRNAVARDFQQIIEHMEAGHLQVDRWITHRTDAQHLPGVFDAWLRPDAKMLKGVVNF